MNVACAECGSTFRVDPSKIPASGVRARCSVCGGVITIGTSGAIDDDFVTPPSGVNARSSRGMPQAPVGGGRPIAAAAPSVASSPQLLQRAAPAAPSVPSSPPLPPRAAPAAPARPSPLVVAAVAPGTRPGTAPSIAGSSSAARVAPPPSAPVGAGTTSRGTASAPPPPVARPPAPPQRPQSGLASGVSAPQPARPAAPNVPGGARTLTAGPGAPVQPPRAAPSIPAAPRAPAAPVSRPAAPPAGGGAAPAPAARPAAVPAAGTAVPKDRTPINPFLANDPNQKAKRLARALVSDIIAYFPQKRQEGLRDGTLKQLFREEIKKSYEEYVDQMGKELAESTSHFQDALNEVLAGGKKIF